MRPRPPRLRAAQREGEEGGGRGVSGVVGYDRGCKLLRKFLSFVYVSREGLYRISGSPEIYGAYLLHH